MWERKHSDHSRMTQYFLVGEVSRRPTALQTAPLRVAPLTLTFADHILGLLTWECI